MFSIFFLVAISCRTCDSAMFPILRRTYYSAGITKAEIELAQDFLSEHKMGDQAYNTRLFRVDTPAGPILKIYVACGEAKASVAHNFRGKTIEMCYGDHAPFMKCLAESIEKASKHVPPERVDQGKMCEKYVKAFMGGNINDHKDSQRAWVKDKGPPVETNIGFIESYRDPFGVRGEFEGFVAVVNREQSRKFQDLVDKATEFIAMLPWPKDFEKDSFLRPDFTSLDVVSFASSGIPAGINIPNYDDIRSRDPEPLIPDPQTSNPQSQTMTTSGQEILNPRTTFGPIFESWSH